MQLVHEINTVTNKIITMEQSYKSVSGKDIKSNSFEMKEKLSSNASVMLMAVASGDNVATMMNSVHKLKETPSLVPCCEGKELQVSKKLPTFFKLIRPVNTELWNSRRTERL